MNSFLLTDKGISRENNQDAVLSISKDNTSLYILCDGMGGHIGGNIACKMCVDTLKEEYQNKKINNKEEAKEWLFTTISKANSEIIKAGNKTPKLKGMGTTVVALIIGNDYRIYASVGDSRLYAYNKKKFIQISEDQTFAAALFKAGFINKKEAKNHPRKNMLLCAVGASTDNNLEIQIGELDLKDNYLMCSDGLYNMIEDNKIKKILDEDMTLKEKCEKLIETANENGGLDNISAIVLEGE